LPSAKGESKFENYNEPINLKKGDIIKLGQKKYQIVEKNIIGKKEPEETNNYLDNIFSEQVDDNKIIITSKGEVEQDKKDNKEKKDSKDNKDNKDNNDNNNIKDNKDNNNKSEEGFNGETDCRICYLYKSTEGNPKLKICKCKNSVIHLNCLKTQLEKNIKVQENPKKTVTLYTWEKFNCEVCQAPYPSKFKNSTGKITYSLIDIVKPPVETNYIILESLPYINPYDVHDKNNKKNIHVVKLTGEDIKIGRNETNDFIDSEPTVSRFHAIL
jgi:hypothetical protein